MPAEERILNRLFFIPACPSTHAHTPSPPVPWRHLSTGGMQKWKTDGRSKQTRRTGKSFFPKQRSALICSRARSSVSTKISKNYARDISSAKKMFWSANGGWGESDRPVYPSADDFRGQSSRASGDNRSSLPTLRFVTVFLWPVIKKKWKIVIAAEICIE